VSPIERGIRHASFRDVLRSIRSCWASLATGDVAAAVEYRDAAQRSMSFTKGLFAHRASVSATCRLERALMEAGFALDAALEVSLRRRDAVHASELVPHLYDSLKVLQREGVHVEDEQLLARARNAAMELAGHFRIEALND
jgi:hypothetical protein